MRVGMWLATVIGGLGVASCDSFFEYPNGNLRQVERDCDALGGSFIGSYNSGGFGACIHRDQVIFTNCVTGGDKYRHRGKCYLDVTGNLPRQTK